MKSFGGILAGGIGSRMATTNGLPKQFLKVGGIPVIVRTVRRFLEMDEFSQVFIALGPDWQSLAKEQLSQFGIDFDRLKIIDGGRTRFDSLVNLAQACANVVADGEEALLVNHDCARPFVSAQILRDNLSAVGNYDMVTTSMPTIDTVLLSGDGHISDSVPERSTVFLDQGPQTFKVQHFLALVRQLGETERGKYMEAGKLYIDKGYRVGIVTGSRDNFKLTTPYDLKFAEFLIKEGGLS